MTEMIERVARALAATKFEAPDPDYFAKHIDAAWPMYVDDARAVIEAILRDHAIVKRQEVEKVRRAIISWQDQDAPLPVYATKPRD
jgi:hypothetical protein